jgi:hypothetical protein
MDERLLNKGRLVETQEKIKEMHLRLIYLRDALRRELDPSESLENLKGESIKLIASDFAGHHRDYIKLLKSEKTLCSAMGMNEHT